MSSFRFNHLAISVKDVKVSIDFYQSVFNFEEIENTASNSKTRWFSIGEDKQLHLIPRPDAEIKTNQAVHFAFTTVDIDAFVKRIKLLNINHYNWLGEPDKIYVRKDGIQQLYFRDPDGYWIEINDAV